MTENQPNLKIGRVVELKKGVTEMRVYLAGENTLLQVNELLKEGFRVMRIFKEGGEIIWETKS